PGEFSLRVVRCIAGRLNPEPSASNSSVLPKQTCDLLVDPDVERAFGLMRSGRVRLLGRNAVGVLCGIERALRIAHVATDVQQRVLRDGCVELVTRCLR